MPEVAITLDLGCCRCRTKIQKILCGLQERCGFVFDKVVYEKDKVVVSGPFDANDLYCKLQCKAGCFATKIEIVPPPKKKKKKNKKTQTTPKAEPNKTKLVCLCPYPYACPSMCPTNPQPTCPFSCATPTTCLCHSCRPPPPPPPPPPQPPSPPPQPCPPPPVCNKCPTWTPCQCRGYPWVVCEQNLPSDGACAVM